MENIKNIDTIVEQLKKDTNQTDYTTYREKIVCGKKVVIIYIDPLTSSDKISDFIVRSLDRINKIYKKKDDLGSIIENEIDNFKIKKITTYKDLCYHLNYGFTILLIEDCDYCFALETKRNLARGISAPQTENALRGAMDSFVEDMHTNIGLIKRRIKDNNLWEESMEIGRHTTTKVSIVYINGICKKELVDKVKEKIQNIDIDGIISSGVIKNLIEKENKSVFPTIFSTERPDKTCQSLLKGKIAILVDCSQFALILPVVMNDLFISTEDNFNKSINITFTRIVRYLAFFITMFTPALYLAMTTYNQEMLPTELLVSFASQRSSVPFPAFFEALLMAFSFEILRECDLRTPTFTTSALSTVGALILGEAAVSAGIVSPIMIIVIAITALSALLFTEPEMINGIRWYRILFMIGASFMGIIGVVITFIYLIIKLCSLQSFGVPYISPFAPVSVTGLKDSIIKFPTKDLNKREEYLSNNITKYKEVRK
ncbi:MAG: spore germination protein [Bacilli bacterium]|nr:spore germination protein [Bacilli bacterium]